MGCGFATLANGLQAYPRCRVPAAPLAGALLISISAVPVSCCAHLSAPDVWQLLVLGATASLHITPCSCAHYPLKGCQLVSSAYRLIRRECVFKVPVGGLVDACSPCAAFSLAWVVLHTMFSSASIILFSFLKFLPHTTKCRRKKTASVGGWVSWLVVHRWHCFATKHVVATQYD